MKIRPAVDTDAAALAAMEKSQPRAAGWGESGFAAEIKLPAALILCAQQDGQLIGFIAARAAGGVAEILNVAVLAGQEKRGIGRRLLTEMLVALKKQGVQQVSLEVAQDNTAACALYEKAGLVRLGQRKDFYGPGRSAWILGKPL